MTHEEAFLRAIRDSRDDDAPRLAYADWLEERGDPRGEFIRVQCELARISADDPRRPALEARERELLAEHGAAWAGPLPAWAGDPEFRRGFVDAIRVNGREFLAQLPAAVGALLGDADFPPGLRLMRRVRVRELPDWWELDPVTTVGTLQTALAAPGLARITGLDLGVLGLSDASGHFLAMLLGPLRLRELILRSNYLGSTGVRDLVTSPAVSHLFVLDLDDNPMGSAGFLALARTPHLDRLTSLSLAGTRPGPDGVRALIDSRTLSALTALDLSHNDLGDAGVSDLAASPAAARFTSLGLNSNRIGDAGAQALVESPHLRGLKSLRMLNNWSISTAQRQRLRERFGDAVRL